MLHEGNNPLSNTTGNLADELQQLIARDDENAAATPMATSVTTPLEKAGRAVGQTVGKTSGLVVNATIAGATVTGRWMRDAAIPATRAGGREFWKGLRATVRATRDAYRESRSKPASHPDEDTLY